MVKSFVATFFCTAMVASLSRPSAKPKHLARSKLSINKYFLEAETASLKPKQLLQPKQSETASSNDASVQGGLRRRVQVFDLLVDPFKHVLLHFGLSEVAKFIRHAFQTADGLDSHSKPLLCELGKRQSLLK